ncbi:MAG TPA: PIN domain-containing protein [Vicinamibacterales bacterium]|nr:PIN domain-containing protein [Vicinamibacterales bacterium]
MILVDTGPLVALCDPRDSRHDMAVSHLSRLAREDLCTCEAVLMEACFHLTHRSQRERLKALLHELDIESLPTHGVEFQDNVFAWLFKHTDHEPDWTDGCLAVLCGLRPRAKVWTYDREFRTTWRRPDGKNIPLAIRA